MPGVYSISERRDSNPCPESNHNYTYTQTSTTAIHYAYNIITPVRRERDGVFVFYVFNPVGRTHVFWYKRKYEFMSNGAPVSRMRVRLFVRASRQLTRF